MNEKQRKRNTVALEWLVTVLFSFVAVLVILVFFVRMVQVDGRSMEPTLQDGERVVAQSIFFKVKRGDIVVIDSYTGYGKPIVKRVIGVAGDTIDIDFLTGEVYVNEQLLQEDYIAAPTTQQYDVTFPLEVPENHVFLLGDNRPVSKDSRDEEIGCIDKRDILGKVFFRIYPFDVIGGIK